MIKHFRGFKSGQSGKSSWEMFSWLGDRLFLVFWEIIPTRVGTLKGNLVQEWNLVCYGKFYRQYVWIIVFSLSNSLNFTMYEDMFHLIFVRNNFMKIVKFQIIHCVKMSWALCFVQLHVLHYVWGYVSSYLYER
jgi:hypothetical protein